MPDIFSPEALAKIVSEATATVPAEHHNAIVGGVDADGAQVVLRVTRDGERVDFQIEGAWRHEWTGKDRVGGQVMVSW